MQTRTGNLIAMAAALGTLAGCGEFAPEMGGRSLFADVRIVQTVASTTLLRVRVGSSTSPLLMPTQTSASFRVPAGDQLVTVETSGGTATGSSQRMTFEAGHRYLVVAQDSAGIAIPAVVSDTGLAPVAGKSKFRVIHSAALAPALDIWRRQPDYDTLIRMQFPLPYRTVTPYMQSDPGDWHLTVSHENQTDTLYASGAISVGAGKLVTVIVMDGATAGEVTAAVVADN